MTVASFVGCGTDHHLVFVRNSSVPSTSPPGELLKRVPPRLTGGGMVRVVIFADTARTGLPQRLAPGDAGAPRASGSSGSCDEISRLGRTRIERREEELAQWLGGRSAGSCAASARAARHTGSAVG